MRRPVMPRSAPVLSTYGVSWDGDSRPRKRLPSSKISVSPYLRDRSRTLISKDWKLWMIDHTRAFRTFDQLRNPTILEWCDRVLLDRLRALDEDALLAALGGYLTRWEIQGVAARARLIVKHFDDRGAERGEGSVLFDWLQP